MGEMQCLQEGTPATWRVKHERTPRPADFAVATQFVKRLTAIRSDRRLSYRHAAVTSSNPHRRPGAVRRDFACRSVFGVRLRAGQWPNGPRRALCRENWPRSV